MNVNNFGWWSIVFFNQISYVVFRFGMISWGSANKVVEFLGGTFVLISFVLMFLIYGIKSGLMLVPIFWFIVTPIGELLISFVKKKVYGERRHRLEEKYGELDSYQKTDRDLIEEVMPGIFENDKKFKKNENMDKLVEQSKKDNQL